MGTTLSSSSNSSVSNTSISLLDEVYYKKEYFEIIKNPQEIQNYIWNSEDYKLINIIYRQRNNAVKFESGNIKTGKRDNGSVFYEMESESDIPQSYAKDNVKKVYSVEIKPQGDYTYTEKEGYQKDSKSDYVFNLIHLIKKQQGGKVSEIYEESEGIEYRVQLEDNNTEHVTVSGIINNKHNRIEYTRSGSKQGIRIPEKYEWYKNDKITRDYFKTGDKEKLDNALRERDEKRGEHN